MDGVEMEAVTQRLCRLERQIRRWKVLGIAAAAVLGLTVVMGAAGNKDKEVAEEIRARRFYVVDRDNKIRVAIAVVVRDGVERGVGLALYDANGKRRASIGLSRDGSNVLLKDTEGRTRAALVVLPNGRPGLALYDESFRPRAAMVAFRDGPVIRLRDANGNPIWTVP